MEQVTAGWDVRARRNDDNLMADGRKRGERLQHTRFQGNVMRDRYEARVDHYDSGEKLQKGVSQATTVDNTEINLTLTVTDEATVIHIDNSVG